jgi:hypothetical protein
MSPHEVTPEGQQERPSDITGTSAPTGIPQKQTRSKLDFNPTDLNSLRATLATT